MAQAPGNIVGRSALHIDALQQRHSRLGFWYAVIKKYGDDSAGHQAALLTYYGFLSLFPLFLIATSLVDFIAQHNTRLRARLLADTTSYFPVVGQQLQGNIHGNHTTGIALVFGILFALYGARGIADAVRGALDTAWGTPRKRRSSFPASLFKSMGLIFGAGLGLLFTTGLASYATAELGHSFIFRLIPIAINAALLYLIVMYVFLLGPSDQHPRRDLRLGAIVTVCGLLILQTTGGYLLTHELHKASGTYGQFALVLTLMFWIYLLAQVFMYSVEVNVVHTRRLWPRSLTGKLPTAADEKMARLHAVK
ncbi:MAG TPA: YihY/virulence factor BrkB family protein [Verrucomicrobiae bacterium]|nr:YihY/virulence factor BrkB family protein [Verrucomicrobiae bacterium]